MYLHTLAGSPPSPDFFKLLPDDETSESEINILLIEGHDGSGKTSLVQEIIQEFPHFQATKFPSKYPEPGTYFTVDEYLSQIDHFFESIGKLLDQGIGPQYLVTDRSFISTMVYQGDLSSWDSILERGLQGLQKVKGLKNTGRKVNLQVLYLHCNPIEAATRILTRNPESPDVVDSQSPEDLIVTIQDLRFSYDTCLDIVGEHLPVAYIDTTEMTVGGSESPLNAILSQ